MYQAFLGGTAVNKAKSFSLWNLYFGVWGSSLQRKWEGLAGWKGSEKSHLSQT
jgi:hypothetical protein